jgi:hypothetical protein
VAQGGIDPAQAGLTPQAGSGETERRENPLDDKLIPGFAGKALEHSPDQDIIHVGISEFGARFGGQRLTAELLDEPVAHLIEVAGLELIFLEQIGRSLVVGTEDRVKDKRQQEKKLWITSPGGILGSQMQPGNQI